MRIKYLAIVGILIVFLIPAKIEADGTVVLSKGQVEKVEQFIENKTVESKFPQGSQTPPVDPNARYKAYIYGNESGNNPKRWNSSGCLGIGQSCPASKLLAVCPSLSYACEDQFFTNYAIERYGSWEKAAYFWSQNRWW